MIYILVASMLCILIGIISILLTFGATQVSFFSSELDTIVIFYLLFLVINMFLSGFVIQKSIIRIQKVLAFIGFSLSLMPLLITFFLILINS